ncbi:MAG: tetratricopeptide repeat protein [Burkholderiales bacterium]|nr:tetratricopeptide repeat protein [Anaerolineae bacterium]
MHTQTPVVRSISWRLVIPQSVVLGLLILLSVLLFWKQYRFNSVALGALIYLTYSYGSRWLLLKDHRQGMVLTGQRNYEAAIEAFKKSYDFFSKNVWIDRYRSLTMMTPASQSYREMALINIAYCYVQLNNYEQAKAYYQRTLREFPDSSMAQAGLNYVESINTNS